MRHRLFIPAATALLFALAACTQDELADGSRLSKEEYPIVIHATGLSVEATPSTRTTVDGDWVGVNSVALKIGDAVKEYTVTATDADGYKSATLTSNDPYYWTSRDPITISAWWPFNNADITQMPAVKVAEDQSKLADFQKSDFISAENRTVEFNNPTLEFTHRTARVAIELKPGTGFTSVAGAMVSLVSLSADNGNPTAIKTYNASGNTYEALTAPQTVAAGKSFVKVELGGGTFYFRPQNNVVLEAGSRYKYTVKVNTTGLTLEGCTIGSWTDGGGESGEAEDLGYIYDSNTKTYTVYNADGLMNIAELVNGGKSDINITLDKNIDLTGKGWTPIGTSFDNSYKGTFDGGGHTITGLTFTTNDEYAGLFGWLNRAGTVKNVVMEGVQITSNQIYGGSIGGVVGYSWGTIENCSVSGSVSGTVYVGGVVGAQIGGSITGCSSSATVKGTVDVGGVTGQTNSSATLTACYATGNVTIEINPAKNIAGGSLVGMNAGSRGLLACYATGNVTSTGSSTGQVHIGGFLGNNYTTVTACYWKNNHEQGIGYKKAGTVTEVTKVDGSVVTWQKAVDAMNTALQNAGSEWRYELNGALPTLRKQ